MSTDGRTGRTVIPGQVVGGPTEGGLDKMLEVVGGAPDPAASHAFLLVVAGTDPGRLHVIDQPEMIIGRSRYADIHISERALSQQHCKLVRHGEYHRLYDLGSTNGTFVNERRVQQVDLKPGDAIRTGETLFTYMSGSSGESATGLPQHAQAHAHAPGPGQAPVSPPVTALAVARPQMGMPPPGALAHQAPPPAYVDVRPAGYGAAQVFAPPPAAEEADLLTWVLRGIDFFRRYWLSILLLTMLGGALGAASYKVAKPSAKGKFEVTLMPLGADNPVEDNRRQAFGYFRDAKNNFARPSLLEETLRQLGETDITPDRLRAAQKALEFEPSGQFSFKGSYTAPTPEEAVKFLEVHLEVYKQAEIDKALRQLIIEAETLEDQVAQAEEKLNATDEALRAFKQENLEGLPDQASDLYKQLIELGSRKSELGAMVTKAQNELQLSRKQLKREDPEIESRIEQAKPFSAGIAEIQKKIATMKSEGKGDQHPKMVEAKEELAALEALRDQTIAHGTTKIVRSKNPVYKSYRDAVDNAETNYKNAMADLSSVTKNLSKTEELVERLPRLQTEYAELTRSYDATAATHADLFQKLNSVRIRLELERAQAAARLDVVVPPNVKPVSKLFTILLRAGIGVFVGFFLGASLGIFRDLRRFLAARLAASRA